MENGIQLLRGRCSGPADAIRWACTLEATAPKVGNVSPDRAFADLAYADFARAAEQTAVMMGDSPQPFSAAVLAAAEAVAAELKTNVNLGILLLLGPLVQADWDTMPQRPNGDWQRRVAETLARCDGEDARRIYHAINLASPGGMGRVDRMDLADQPPPDLLSAMRSAAGRDRIARNYADGFRDLFDHVVPVLDECITACADVLTGVSEAHLRLLAMEPDTLIGRKFGPELARSVQHQASVCCDDPSGQEAFDAWLRERKCNPGTTADLIAAALYVVLRRAS